MDVWIYSRTRCFRRGIRLQSRSEKEVEIKGLLDEYSTGTAQYSSRNFNLFSHQ